MPKVIEQIKRGPLGPELWVLRFWGRSQEAPATEKLFCAWFC